MSIEQERIKYRKKMHLKIFGVAVLLACLYGAHLYKGKISQEKVASWPTVDGEITESAISLSPSSTNKVVVYEHTVQYTYKVDGSRYYAHVTLAASGYRDEIEAKVSSVAAGTKVVVSYEPGNESNAHLVQ